MESSFDVGKGLVIDFIDVNVRGRGILVMAVHEIPGIAVSREHRHPGKRCLCLTSNKAYHYSASIHL
jgi:hypothetical protein